MNSAKSHSGVLSSLKGTLAHTDILLSETEQFAASFDSLKISCLPEAVFRVYTQSDVGEILKAANEHGIPVTCRGAGSSTTGSATPIKKGWVIDFSRLKEITVNSLDACVVAEAGATIESIQLACEKEKLFYPPDPSSFRYCTIGGAVSTNAGGLRGAKYGVTRDYVLSLKGFFANGAPFHFGRNVRKFSAGFNLRDLLIGSEGSLAVITEVSLRLTSLPKSRWTCLGVFPSEEKALNTVHLIAQTRIMPSILEFIDSEAVACVLQKCGNMLGLSDPTVSLLLIELDGCPSELKSEQTQLLSMLKTHALLWDEADYETARDELWEVRRMCSQAMFVAGDTKLNEDVVVPMESQVKLLQYINELRRKFKLAMPTFGHVADGNFHVNIMYNKDDAIQCANAKEAVAALMKRVVELGGAISGEHGIGLSKSPFFSLQHNSEEIKMMQEIKKVFDPNNILNPGKIFYPFNVWEHEKVKAKLPWDK